jgi:methionyl-tRNA formyltransferase
MRIVFMGFQTWGYVALKALLGSKHCVPLVFTHPESSHPYEAIWNDSVKELAQAHGIPIIEQRYANEESTARIIAEAKPDIIVLSDWRTWLSPQIYAIAEFGTINIHDSLLPKYGGFSPTNWAIINGEMETGVTVHFVEEEIDLGDIILQQKISIAHTDTATDVFHKTLPVISRLTLEAIDLIEYRRVKPIQQDRSQATFFHKRSERDSLIDWRRNSMAIYNLIRAQSDPYPNAYTYYKGKKLRIKKASLPHKCYCGTPGRVFCPEESGIVVVCGPDQANPNQGIILELVQEENGEVIKANHYFDRMGYSLGE